VKYLHALIIIKPSAVNDKLLGQIISKIEQAGLIIEGIKTDLLDIHGLKNKINKEQDLNKIDSLKEGMKVPCVLMVVFGKNVIEICKTIESEFETNIHASANEEVAKYEISRFFKTEELFAYNSDVEKISEVDSSPKLWKKYANKSVEQIEKDEKK